MREITEGLYQVPSGQLFLASGDYDADYGTFYNGQVVVVPHTVANPAAAMAALINRDGGGLLLSPLPGGCCVPPPVPPASPLYGSTPDGRAHGVALWCIGDYSSDYFPQARDGEYVVQLYNSPQITEMLGVMQRDGAVIGPSMCGVGLVDPPAPSSDTCEDIMSFPVGIPTPATQLVGADCRVYTVLDIVQSGETTTTLGYNAGTQELVYTDEDGGVTIISLSALLDDINVANVSYNPGTGILTITETDLTVHNVNVGTSPTSVVNSIIGDGTPGNPLQLSGDLLAPGAGRYYGTNNLGVKGWYAFSPTVSILGGNLTVTIGGVTSPALAGILTEDAFGVDLGYLLPL